VIGVVWVIGAVWEARPVDLGAVVVAERQAPSRELVGVAMYVAPASAVPQAVVGASVAAAVAAGASVAVEAAVAAVGAGVEAGSCFIYLLSLTKGALRRKCTWFEAPEILPTSHRAGAGA
jgi:hypothetical protein